MTFQLLDLLLFPAIGQGFVMAFLLWRLPSSHQSINRSLALFLTLASCLIIGRILFFRLGNPSWVPLALLADTAIFLFGPLLYQYARRLSHNPGYVLKWYHGLPSLIHVFSIVFFAFLGRSFFIQITESGAIWSWFIATEGAGLLLNLGYWIASFLTIRSAIRQQTLKVFQSRASQRFLQFSLGLLGVGLFTWLASYIAGWGFQYWLNYISYHTLWLCLAGFTYLMGISMLLRPELYRTLQQAISQKISPQRERLNKTQREQLATKLDTLMGTEALFRQGDLTQKVLAEALDTSVHNLSWILNQHYEKTFSEYLNQLRLDDFIARVAQGEHRQKTLLALALEAGFSSKSTFNRVFKERYQCSPSQYIAQQAA